MPQARVQYFCVPSDRDRDRDRDKSLATLPEREDYDGYCTAATTGAYVT